MNYNRIVSDDILIREIVGLTFNIVNGSKSVSAMVGRLPAMLVKAAIALMHMVERFMRGTLPKSKFKITVDFSASLTALQFFFSGGNSGCCFFCTCSVEESCCGILRCSLEDFQLAPPALGRWREVGGGVRVELY